jgi:hypothetical protein
MALPSTHEHHDDDRSFRRGMRPSMSETQAQPAERRGAVRPNASPLLDQICHGGSAVALNLARLSALPPESRLFRCSSLNSTVIFKYPNFDREIAVRQSASQATPGSQEAPAAPETAAGGRGSSRPIETAIFVPHDPRDLTAGGYGIYLRQRDFQALLKRHVGLDLDSSNPDFEQDVAVLEAIDRIPSLDPFLLKGALSFCAGRVDGAYFSISPDEEAAVREAIAQKLRPIVARALALEAPEMVRERTEHFLDSLWNPELPEAAMFLRALGIPSENARSVIEGWKGIAYYKVNFDRAKDGVIALVKWLDSGAALPREGKADRARFERLAMFRTNVRGKLKTVSQQMIEVFKRYDGSHQVLLAEGKPGSFRTFLENVDRYYWVLGYCSMSLRHCSSIFVRHTADGTRDRLTYAELEEMLGRINTTLSSQSDGKCL